jgi:probable F420-dependent oxidoreductase
VKFWLSPAFCDSAHLTGLAKAAEEHGYEGIAIPDHLFHPVQLASPYPYTPDGNRFWTRDQHWPDPWVAIAAMAAVTTRLKFTTNIYVAPSRDLLTVAKSLATAAYLSQNGADGAHRVLMGVGPGWCEEEFEATGQRFDKRGKRMDEMLLALHQLWTGDDVKISGEFYNLPEASIAPTPNARIPVLVGGETDLAIRRAARNDGWIGLYYTMEDAEKVLLRLRAAREKAGTLDNPDFRTILTILAEPNAENCARIEELGGTDLLTAPWMGGISAMTPPGPSLAEMTDALADFAAKYIND